MDELTYVFIDGNYLRMVHREVMQDFFGVDGELDLSPIRRAAAARRVYIYDALDDEAREGESEEKYEDRVERFDKFLKGLGSLEGYHFRPGSVKRGKRREKKREQKEVDVLLAVDMMAFGLTDRIKKAVLISGDLDFRPAVEELVRHGVVVHVWYSPTSFSEALVEAADLGVEMRLKDFWRLSPRSFQERHRLPDERKQGGNGGRNGRLEKVGSVSGQHAELYCVVSGAQTLNYSLWITNNEHDSTIVWDTDLDLIERYVTRQFGEIDWQMTGEEIALREASALKDLDI